MTVFSLADDFVSNLILQPSLTVGIIRHSSTTDCQEIDFAATEILCSFSGSLGQFVLVIGTVSLLHRSSALAVFEVLELIKTGISCVNSISDRIRSI